MKKSLTGLIASVAMTAVTLGASAQESRAEHAPTHDWTGPYIGALVGIGSFEAEAMLDEGSSDSCSVGTCPVPVYPMSDSGFMGGLSVGWNAQDGHMVYSIVGDVMFGEIDDSRSLQQTSGTLTVQTDLFATIRGRVGVAADYVLFYGTAGLAILDGEATVSDFGDGDQTSGFTALGGVVGAGAELAISENVSFQAELLYAFFDESIDLDLCCDDDNGVKVENFYSVRFGVNWHF